MKKKVFETPNPGNVENLPDTFWPVSKAQNDKISLD